MNVVVACDKFKGSLTAVAAAAAIRRGLRRRWPRANIVLQPLADGGDGTTAVLHAALGGRWVSRRVTGPLPGQTIRARYLWLPGPRLAIIETAAASGLARLDPAQRRPLRATTYGTGQLLADAIRRGARRILLGLGGSATTDGGVGAATALGWQFRDRAGNRIGLGGGELSRIHTVLPPPAWNPPPIEVLCDVTNPLCGPHGAAAVFGPQKGATPAMVRQLDAGLRHLARRVGIPARAGAGAAGGFGGGAVAFLNGRLVPGIETIARLVGLADKIRAADLVITGEGRFDEQSLDGKVVSGVLRLARRHRVAVIILAGEVVVQPPRGVVAAISLRAAGLSRARAMRHAAELLTEAAELTAVRSAPSGNGPLRGRRRGPH